MAWGGDVTVELAHLFDATQWRGWGGEVTIPRSVTTLTKGKINAALHDYLQCWLWLYSHIPQDLNVISA